MAFEDYYDQNPLAVIDQNNQVDHVMEVRARFQTAPVVFTPLIDYTNRSQITGASDSRFTEILEGDVDSDELPLAAKYILSPIGADSRERRLIVKRYGDKVIMDESLNIFQMWRMDGGRDWRPLLRSLLGNNVIRKLEVLARNAFLQQDQSFWTYAGGGSDFSDLDENHKFDINITNEWNLRLGNNGTPVIPGDVAGAKVAILPPGCVYDFRKTLAAATNNEAELYTRSMIARADQVRYEIQPYNDVRFVVTPNDTYGQNLSILYNAGNIDKQYGVSSPINAGDGAPDPEVENVDGTWYIGQKDVTHYIQLDAHANMAYFTKNDIVSIHTVRTNAFGITNGVDFRSGKTINRRVVKIDTANRRLSFDRPIMRDYTTSFTGTPDDSVSGTYYAYVTKATHVGMVLVLGSRGGVIANVNRGLKFYEPAPIDDFNSVFRFTWDIVQGYNIWEPNLFELHFCALTLPKVGGVIEVPGANGS